MSTDICTDICTDQRHLMMSRVKSRLFQPMLLACLVPTYLLATEGAAEGVAPQAQMTPAWAEAVGTDAHGPWARLQIGSHSQILRRIPAGRFTMGISAGPAAEKPLHDVVLSQAFWLGDSEVTQGVWQQVMGHNPSRFTGDANRPVEEITWDSAQQFHTRLNHLIPALHARFPSEAQWEYACRAGTTGDTAKDFAAGAWFAGNADQQSHPVKLRQPNAWGLYDMLGNVSEWCFDFKGDYPTAEQTDPTGPTTGAYRISRGGYWSSAATSCTPGQRGWDMQDTRGDIVGLRLAVPDPH